MTYIIVNWNSLAANIMLPKTKPILIGVVYRPLKDSNFYMFNRESVLGLAIFVHQETYSLTSNTDVINKKKTMLVNSHNSMVYSAWNNLFWNPQTLQMNQKWLLTWSLLLVKTCDSIIKSKLGVSDFSPTERDSFYDHQRVSKDSCSLAVEEGISKLLDSLNVHKSIWCDQILGRFLKDGASIIACPLTNIINLSLNVFLHDG